LAAAAADAGKINGTAIPESGLLIRQLKEDIMLNPFDVPADDTFVDPKGDPGQAAALRALLEHSYLRSDGILVLDPAPPAAKQEKPAKGTA
jgi:hypothetical protein